MSFLVLYFSSFLVALSGALMPGPLLAVTLGNSPRFGWKFGPLAVFGHGILELGLVTLVFLGAGPVLQAGAVQGWIGLAGGFILVQTSGPDQGNAVTGRYSSVLQPVYQTPIGPSGGRQ